MEQSEREKLLEDMRAIVREETSPILDILMVYLDVRFDEIDQEFSFIFTGIKELIDRLAEPID